VLGDPAVRAVLTWGITDRYTWLGHEEGRADGKPERPLLFDAAGKAKASFYAVRDAFDQRGQNRTSAAKAAEQERHLWHG